MNDCDKRGWSLIFITNSLSKSDHFSVDLIRCGSPLSNHKVHNTVDHSDPMLPWQRGLQYVFLNSIVGAYTVKWRSFIFVLSHCHLITKSRRKTRKKMTLKSSALKWQPSVDIKYRKPSFLKTIKSLKWGFCRLRKKTRRKGGLRKEQGEKEYITHESWYHGFLTHNIVTHNIMG